jgi:UDP-N-acetylmuramate: L-alanyl-gamma-D-glutamyl-meso-diaminopimelate ligase
LLKLLILGISEPLMTNVALLASELGVVIIAADYERPVQAVMLKEAGIKLNNDYDVNRLLVPPPDLVVVGSKIERGNPCIEQVLNKQIPFMSGPEFLYQYVLKKQHVLAICGDKKQSSVINLLVWVLQKAGLAPGYLYNTHDVADKPAASLGQQNYFIIEAAEQVTAFFDHRAQFLHYHPRTLIINSVNLPEQYPYLLRHIPAAGAVIYEAGNKKVEHMLQLGCWSAQQTIGEGGIWQARAINTDGSQFELWHRADKVAIVNWELYGFANVMNALVVMATAHELGITVPQVVKAFEAYQELTAEV